MYTTVAMRSVLRAGLFCLWLTGLCAATAYNARPRLIVVIVIDQYRADYLERYRDLFGEGGFRLFLDHGAYFTDCNYDYANTRTAPGHATLFTGAYSNGHGIVANEWWDPQKKKIVTSVEDDATHLVGVQGGQPGASPHNLLADTLGDELKLATQGKSRVFAIALKDRAAILPGGFAADAAYWIDRKSGAWLTSTYYRSDLPKWVQDFNDAKHADKYLNQEWKDSRGNLLRSTRSDDKNGPGFYENVGSTPFANDYEFDFAREMIVYEKLGAGPATDLLAIGLSANDILGHQAGPDSPEMQAMSLALDRQLADFFAFLGHQIGLANVWIALSADHGVAPIPSVAAKLRIPAAAMSAESLRAQLNKLLSARMPAHKSADYVRAFDYPLAWLNQDAFEAIKMKEDEAEHMVGETLKQIGLRGYYTKSQLAEGQAPNTSEGREYLHSYSPEGGWYVFGIPAPFSIGSLRGTDHASPYTYDRHVPLAFYGIPFQSGTYRTHCEPVDLAVTMASLLGINAPTSAVGRVLTEALVPPRHSETPASPANQSPAHDSKPSGAAVNGGSQ